MMTKYTVEMLVVSGTITTYFDVPVTPCGAPSTTDKETALTALSYWRGSMPAFQFQLTEWAPRLLSEA